MHHDGADGPAVGPALASRQMAATLISLLPFYLKGRKALETHTMVAGNSRLE